MRRALASLLVAIFGLLAAAPVLLADDSSSLPACCRRFGKHHCSLYESEGPALKGVCNSYIHPLPAATAPSGKNPAILAAAGTLFESFPVDAAPAVWPAPVLRVPFEPSHPKRGPPAVSL